MSEIKRYDLVTVGSDWHCIDRMEQRPDGEWVRWEDVERLLRGRDTLMKMVEGMIKEKLESDKTQDTGHK